MALHTLNRRILIDGHEVEGIVSYMLDVERKSFQAEIYTGEVERTYYDGDLKVRPILRTIMLMASSVVITEDAIYIESLSLLEYP